MNPADFWKLQAGDLVESSGGVLYMVASNFGTRLTAVRTADLTNPFEWKLVAKAKYIPVPE
jgi:hypothetical protein